MNFADISFKKKILILLALPMIGFLWLSISSISKSISTSTEMTRLTALTNLTVVYSELVHELQKERGLTAGFIGSNGKKFGNKLNSQRVATNQKLAQRKNHWLNNEFDQQQIKQLHSTINQHLNQLEKIRTQVDSQSIKVSQAIAYYTQLNKNLLSISGLIANISSDSVITGQIIAYYNFLQGKERAGIERAILSNTFAQDKLELATLIKFVTLVSEQDTYFGNFNTFSNDENKRFFAQQLSNSSVDEVLKMREVVKTQTANFNTDPGYWFDQATARIGQLKKTENKLATDLLQLAKETKDAAFSLMLFNIIFSTLLTVIALVISVYTIRELTARVRDLTSVMAQVRDNNDLSVQTKLSGASELGQISSALNLTLSKFSGAINEISNSSIALASAAEETSQTCEYNSTSMLEQQDQIALIATAVEELSATVKEVASNTQQTTTSARAADEKTQNGLVVVKQSYQSIESLAGEIDGLAQRINSLHGSSQNITNVVDVIKSVADQTNLLALNAAIEAARAGEQGRGFAVVADEVRTLAQRTQDSTAEIESFITSLQSDATAAFNVIEASQAKATEAVQYSKNVEHTLGDITEAVSNIFAMTEQVAVAIEEQSVVTQNVAQNVVSVEQKSMESTTGATQIAATAKEQAQLAVTLQGIASNFKI